jgi:DNA polymerase-3 subunit delta
VSHTIHVFDYLAAPAKYPPAAVCVTFGDEPFLKRLGLKQLRGDVLGDMDAPFATFDGEGTDWRDVVDELATISLFGGGRKRLAVIENADKFVTEYRARLEDYVQKPASRGVLVLDVSTWLSNTRLYKALDQTGLQIECRPPGKPAGRRKVLDEGRLTKWLVAWARTQHGTKLLSAAAKALLELVGPQFGLLDQELAKLALFTTPGGEITAPMVQDVVGGWRAKTVWELLDAACDGQAGEALQQLDRLLHAGENPLAIFGGIMWSLRRFAAATRIIERAERERRKATLGQALQQAGFQAWPAALEKAERQLRQIGRERAAQLYRWLLDADLALKGTHSAPDRARLALELLLARLAKQLAPRKGQR